MPHIEPLGDRAFLARFDVEGEAAAWSAAVRAWGWPGIEAVVPAFLSAAVFADPGRIELETLEQRLRELRPAPGTTSSTRLVELPVLYDGQDLAEVSQRVGLSTDEVIAAHAGRDYDVRVIGFLPGFLYTGPLPEALRGLPRREPPRLRVPGGSVAIVGEQTGVYPSASPGGWNLIGRTPLRIVDVDQGHFPVRAGDRIRFIPIDRTEYDARNRELLR